jgi:hypothetical protein
LVFLVCVRQQNKEFLDSRRKRQSCLNSRRTEGRNTFKGEKSKECCIESWETKT